MATQARSARSETGMAVNLIGLTIVVVTPFTGGGQRAIAAGSDYWDQHPAVHLPLTGALLLFVLAAVALQQFWGFMAAELIGLLLASALFFGTYQPARWALPWFGPDRATCSAGQVVDKVGTHCVAAPRKAARR
jgi:hypothetical protein